LIQGALIRLGFDPGRIDGILGDRTRSALREAGIDEDNAVSALSALLQAAFPREFVAT